MTIPASVRREVVQRAENRCEYCGLSQAGQEAVFHVDHITPVIAGGATALHNLALACVSCSLRKGARRMVVDAESGEIVPIFDPRRDSWREHFHWVGARVHGITAKGRATLNALSFNRPLAVAIREEETLRFQHPPPGHS